jgi:predicted enzyme related to lactoylglutathione lyase
MRLIHVTILVKDHDEALDFYTKKLGFRKVADTTFGPGERWLTVAPKGQKDMEIVLQKPSPAMHGKARAKQMMNQVGRGTTWAFEVDDCRKACERLRKKGVEIVSEPEEMPYGVQAVFADLYGNSLVLIERP